MKKNTEITTSSVSKTEISNSNVSDKIDPQHLAEIAHLTYVSDDKKGIKRIKNGEGFYYVLPNGEKVTDKKEIERIENLGIPPAWVDVWVSTNLNGHIQATGKDEKGRKQYIYHALWTKYSQENKFNRMLFFSKVLPDIRRQVRIDLKIEEISQKKVLAVIVWLLEHTYIRIGNEEYAKDNKHYGLTTLRTKHVEMHGQEVRLSFFGKSGKVQEVDITHPKIVKTIRKLEELPGYELFKYVDSNGERRSINSQEVNEYLRSITGEYISAKDFRTWGGTVLSAVTLNVLGPFETKKDAKKNITQTVKEVAKKLRNTPAVARKYYIHPAVLESYEKGQLIPHFKKIWKESPVISGLTKAEYAIVKLLEKH